MSEIRPETHAFLRVVERSAGRKFRFERDIALLLEVADQASIRQHFDDLTFYGKFVSHAAAILKRQGLAAEETASLSAELEATLKKTAKLMETILMRAPAEPAQSFRNRFLSHSPPSLESFLALLAELSWIKNYVLDQDRGAG